MICIVITFQHVLHDTGVNYGWIEVNAQHAFIRDEMSKVLTMMIAITTTTTTKNDISVQGRYDPALTRCCMTFALDLFHRVLVLACGDCRAVTGSSAGPALC